MMKTLIKILLLFLLIPQLKAQLTTISPPNIPLPEFTVYISVSGDDENEGTIDSPVHTFQKAISLIPFDHQKDVFGEIVYLEGDYYPETPRIKLLINTS